MNDHLFIFGFGFTSSAVATKIRSDFKKISGTTRSTKKTNALKNAGISPLIFDGKPSTAELLSDLRSATHLLVSIAPDETGDPVLNAIEDQLQNFEKLKWIGYFSTVGVYGNHDGAWVNEETPCKPVSKRSIQRLAAEGKWLEKGQKLGIPVAVFRLSGIYGPGRNAFTNIQKGSARRLVKKGQVFNRIHCEDIASAVALAIQNSASGIFNITDDLPSPPQDVVCYAHALMGIPPPPEIDFETAELTPMARSFYGENKRVANAKSRAVLGLEYAWPDYRYSLEKMWKEKSWRV